MYNRPRYTYFGLMNPHLSNALQHWPNGQKDYLNINSDVSIMMNLLIIYK